MDDSSFGAILIMGLFVMISMIYAKNQQKRQLKRDELDKKRIEKDEQIKQYRMLLKEGEKDLNNFLGTDVKYVLNVVDDSAKAEGKILLGKRFAYIMIGERERLIRNQYTLSFNYEKRKTTHTEKRMHDIQTESMFASQLSGVGAALYTAANSAKENANGGYTATYETTHKIINVNYGTVFDKARVTLLTDVTGTEVKILKNKYNSLDVQILRKCWDECWK